MSALCAWDALPAEIKLLIFMYAGVRRYYIEVYSYKMQRWSSRCSHIGFAYSRHGTHMGVGGSIRVADGVTYACALTYRTFFRRPGTIVDAALRRGDEEEIREVVDNLHKELSRARTQQRLSGCVPLALCHDLPLHVLGTGCGVSSSALAVDAWVVVDAVRGFSAVSTECAAALETFEQAVAVRVLARGH
jgi:hypothetical protein